MYRDADGKRRSAGTFDAESDAQTAADTAEAHARAGGQASDPLWRDWVQVWSERRTAEESTKRRDESRINTHLLPKWGDMRLSEITRVKAQDWVKGELAHLSPSTVRKCVAVLGASLKAAANAGYRCELATRGLELPEMEPSPERWLSKAEAAAVRDVLDPKFLFTFDMLLGTGMRWGELCGLHWDQVDLESASITVRWSWDGQGMKSTKTRKPRVVPIGTGLVGVLRARLDEAGLGEPPGVPYAGNRPLYGLVMPGAKGGRPLTSTSFSAALSAAGRAAFVGEGAARRRVGHVRVHDLRHSYASQLVQSGVPLDTVQKLLGHSSVLVTQRYADAATSQWDSVREVLG